MCSNVYNKLRYSDLTRLSGLAPTGKNRCDDAEDPPCKRYSTPCPKIQFLVAIGWRVLTKKTALCLSLSLIRCRVQGIECVFEQPMKQASSEEERLAAVEASVLDLHTKVDSVLQALQHVHQHASPQPSAPMFPNPAMNQQMTTVPPPPPPAGLPASDPRVFTSQPPFIDHTQLSAGLTVPLHAPVTTTTTTPRSDSVPNLPFPAPTPGSWGPPLPISSAAAAAAAHMSGHSVPSETELNSNYNDHTHLSPASSTSTSYQMAENGGAGGGSSSRPFKRPRHASSTSSIVNYPAPRPRPSANRRTSLHQTTLQHASSPHQDAAAAAAAGEPSPEGSNLTAPFEALADAAALAAEGAPDPLSRARTPPNGVSEAHTNGSRPDEPTYKIGTFGWWSVLAPDFILPSVFAVC